MRQPAATVARKLAIQRVRERLERESFPRTQMALMVSLTGGFGLLASFTMLQLGVGAMAVRYPLALSMAYLFFLFLIWLWLRTNAEDYAGAPDIAAWVPRRSVSTDVPGVTSGGGGDFGGGGASGAFDGPAAALDDAASTPISLASDSASAVADADELAIPLLAVALAVGIALASVYVVCIAPLLFAEVLVDGALSYALFRHLRGQESRHWLSSAFRRTALPFAATAAFLTAAGLAMTAYAPGAKSVGQFIVHAGGRGSAR